MSQPWYEEARRLIGTKEIVGKQHNPTIIGWIRNLGARVLGIQPKDDETPWCGTFVAHCMTVAGIEPPKVAIRAMSYHVLGGNQSNSVNITRIEKSRCVARRWPRGVKWSGGPVWVKAGGAISKNEA